MPVEPLPPTQRSKVIITLEDAFKGSHEVMVSLKSSDPLAGFYVTFFAETFEIIDKREKITLQDLVAKMKSEQQQLEASPPAGFSVENWTAVKAWIKTNDFPMKEEKKEKQENA